MRSQGLRRTVAAAVVVPALVFSVAACGGDSGGGGKKGGGAGGGGGEEAPKPLTKSQLSAALLKTGDVAGYKVRKTADPLKNDNLPQAQSQCKPVLDSFTPDAKQKRKAYVGGSIAKGEMSTGQSINQVLLASYESDDAEAVLSDLKSGLKTCKEISGKGKDGKAEKVTIQEAPAPEVGDDSVRFLLSNTTSKSASLSMTVIRSGANTTSFMSLSLGGKEATVPDAVAKKQVAKVEAAAKG